MKRSSLVLLVVGLSLGGLSIFLYFRFANLNKEQLSTKNGDLSSPMTTLIPTVAPPPVPIPSDDERTPARKTGETWWLGDNKWVMMTRPVGEIIVHSDNTQIWSVLGTISKIDSDSSTSVVVVEFAQKNCVLDLSNLGRDIQDVSYKEEDMGPGAEVIFESSENTLLCGVGSYVVENIEIRWRIWNKTVHTEPKKGSIADLESGDVVWIEANSEDFIKLEGNALRVLATQ